MTIQGTDLRRIREGHGWSRADLARRLRSAAGAELPSVESLVSMIKVWERGKHAPSRHYAPLLASVLRPLDGSAVPTSHRLTEASGQDLDDELEALDLTRRISASDTGDETLALLETAFENLAVGYSRTPPAELLLRVRRNLAYVARLLDGRKTLAQHRRLIVLGGWLSLLGATCHVDLRQRPAAAARLRTAARLAEEAGHPEISAWCLETEAWQALTEGDYPRTVILARSAQEIAPKSGSAFIQASAQEGRAHARLGDVVETHRLLDRVTALAGSLPDPERPEHHYRYDPAKSTAYAVTTLAWLGDPAAEPLARQVLARLETPSRGPSRPRRTATARLDLSLALVAGGEVDEAVQETLTAVTSGLLVPSTYWRAAEIVQAVEARGASAAELREACRAYCPPARRGARNPG